MVEGNLHTTNVLLGIMAAVSVLQVVALAVVCVMGYRLYRQAMRTVHDIEHRQMAPLVEQVNGLVARVDTILGDVKRVTARVTHRTERVDAAIDHTVYRVDEAAGRVRTTLRWRATQLKRLVHRGTRALRSFFHGRDASGEAPAL